jgi:CRISPR/Cas system CSM-associated protein Csm2 small subunit
MHDREMKSKVFAWKEIDLTLCTRNWRRSYLSCKRRRENLLKILPQYIDKVNRYFSANQGHNFKTEKAVKLEIKLDFPLMVPDLVYKFQIHFNHF